MIETTKWKVLLVDDERASREAMGDWLESEGFEVITAADEMLQTTSQLMK